MKYQPITSEEAKQAQFKLLEPGVYDFEIISAQDKTSKSGNEMIELKLKVFDSNGNSSHVFDYLLPEKMAYKFRHCCEAIEIIDKYEGGELVADDFIGGTGEVKIKIDKNKDANYPDKNAVVDYLGKRSKEERETTAKNHGIKKKKASEELNDAIPDWD